MFKLILTIVLYLTCAYAQTRFHVTYEWKYINFTWPSTDAFKEASLNGRYIPENIHISGVKYFEDYLYLTVPRMKDGVPATLVRIPANSNENNTAPLLSPYPSWEMNLEGDCSALQNVQNVEIDSKGLLWILDGGRSQTLTKQPQNKCQPRLLIYNIKTNSIVRSYKFPNELRTNGSFLYDIAVDDVDEGYAYITDNSAIDPAIIVYSMKLNKAWIIRDPNTMRAQDDAVEFTVNGTSVPARINLAGIALGPQITRRDDHGSIKQDRMVYYSPLSSYRLYAINSVYLRDERSATTGIASYVKDLGRRESQSDGMVMDENGVLYYGLLSTNSIGKWDSATPFTTGQKVIARDREFIQWPDSLAFDMSGNLLVVTNKLQKFIYGGMSIDEPNFRILEGHVGAKSYLYGSPMEAPMDNPMDRPMGPPTRISTEPTMPTTPIQMEPKPVEETNHTYYETQNTHIQKIRTDTQSMSTGSTLQISQVLVTTIFTTLLMYMFK